MPEEVDEQIIKKEILVPLNDEKIAAQAKIGGKLQVEIDQQEKAFDVVKQEFEEKKRAHTESIKQKEARISEIMREVDTGRAKITDDVLMRKNFQSNTVEFLWPAVGEEEKMVVETRAMTEEERQANLFQEAEAIPEEGQALEAE